MELQPLPPTANPSPPPQDTAHPEDETLGDDIPGLAGSSSMLHRLSSTPSAAALSDIGEEYFRQPPSTTPGYGIHSANDSIDGTGHEDNEEDDDDDDDEVGVYHCREESIEGAPGRLVAIYRPARAANRARDIPARSCKLEIYAEIGERCETALMFMCSRLDDLFMSIPESKRMPANRRRRRRQDRTRRQGQRSPGGRGGQGSPLTTISSFGVATAGTAGGARDDLAEHGHAGIGDEGEGEGGPTSGPGWRAMLTDDRGARDSTDTRHLPTLESPMTLKALLRQNRTRRVLKMVVAIALIVLVVVLILRSSNR
ncbi:hypothetical protein BGZ73_007219 [Actinomortierella ambigua]|nr:hypothetical protein BGZ73_007219 [Actinomortierella ambigua]